MTSSQWRIGSTSECYGYTTSGIIETMENMSANGINAEEVGQSLQEVESMKQKVQDSLDEFMSMVVNGNYEEERPEQFGEVAELVAKVKADFGPFQLEMVEERNACMFTPPPHA